MPRGHLKTKIGMNDPTGVYQWSQVWSSSRVYLDACIASPVLELNALRLVSCQDLFLMELGGGVRMLVSTLHQVACLCQAKCVVGAGKSELCSGTPKTHVLIAHANRLSMPQFPQLTCQISVGTAVSLAVVLILAVVPLGPSQGLDPADAGGNHNSIIRQPCYETST